MPLERDTNSAPPIGHLSLRAVVNVSGIEETIQNLPSNFKKNLPDS